MAFDTAEKRASMFSHGCRFHMGKAYVPNGSIDEGHRFQSLTFYSGNSLVPLVAAETDDGGGYFAASHFGLVCPSISGTSCG